ncbi:MAG: urease accessory UreF family protein [Pseudomonadota bacterium]
MTETPDPQALLLAWLSPGYPVGAFAYSHGLEAAIAAGAVQDAKTLADWIADALAHGAGRTDAILAAHAVRAEGAGLAELADLARALAPSEERLMETALPGAAFARTTREGWGIDVADAPFPVALGAAAGAAGIAPGQLLPAMLQAFATNLVSAGVRLIPIGQTEGQRVVAGLMPLIARVASEAEDASLDEIGSAAFALDIVSQRHETQTVRLFRS